MAVQIVFLPSIAYFSELSLSELEPIKKLISEKTVAQNVIKVLAGKYLSAYK